MKQTLFSSHCQLSIYYMLAFSFLAIVSLSSSDDVNSGDINSWCDITPHPEPCKFYMNRDPERFKQPKDRAEFRTICIQAALDQAVHAQCDTKELGPFCKSRKRKTAWNDCDHLVDDTVFQLNSTLQGLQSNQSFTTSDAQTWLSTALTNIETCRSGSVQLNVSDFLSPIHSRSNLTKLLSNSLAINGGLEEDDGEEQIDGYPSWVTATDRKLIETTANKVKSNVVVAKDGSGQFKSIQAAINFAVSKRARNQRVVIYLKKGVYKENIAITNTMGKVTLIGDGFRSTIITGSRSVAAGFTTYSSATVGVDGIGFIARGITFQNTAGPQKGQAVALRSASDLSVFYYCAFEGYQDTLFVHAQRQFYKACLIYGTIDFIFGNAAVVFQDCAIYVRKPLYGQVNVVTAQGRADPYQNTGISIHNCHITPASDLKPVVKSYQTYLGRPWQQYSRTVILTSNLDSFVNPAGWLTWLNTKFALNTLYYGEYQNYGVGASTRNRVKWPGYHVITSPTVASRFSVGSLIAGKAWLPSTGVKFTAGL
ncbi:esterase [Lithospermum erythrorhizon]|uniref:Pectinesterase n=1 Tax=Lithospermum erythrorhizon TaxID=34254 RepID=A0AAV3QUZ5_LITER